MRHVGFRLARSVMVVMGVSVLFVGGCAPPDDGSIQTFAGDFLRNLFAALLL